MKQPCITVILPLKHYHPHYLNKSIESVTNQSCPYWYLRIVVEPSDLDHFTQLLETELNDSRIEIVVNQGRKLSGAINTGMKCVQTEFVAILLGDDTWANDAIEVLSDYLFKYPHIDFFHSSRVVIDEEGNRISSIYRSKERFTLQDFTRGSPIKHLLCWRRSFALSIGGLDESLNSVGPDDWDFPWMMAEQNAAFMAVQECLYYYRDHREAFRGQTHYPLSVHKREIRRILRKHGVGWLRTIQCIAEAKKSYLRQCLYRNRFDKWIKEKLGHDARKGWRQHR